jgi:hypothetical protein
MVNTICLIIVLIAGSRQKESADLRSGIQFIYISMKYKVHFIIKLKLNYMKKIIVIGAAVLAITGTALVASNVCDCPICPEGTYCPMGGCDSGDCSQK